MVVEEEEVVVTLTPVKVKQIMVALVVAVVEDLVIPQEMVVMQELVPLDLPHQEMMDLLVVMGLLMLVELLVMVVMLQVKHLEGKVEEVETILIQQKMDLEVNHQIEKDMVLINQVALQVHQVLV
tara:strand:+ start:227 stop:601 length:375 start_codon:yes stop_codon:yes gene_type:complete